MCSGHLRRTELSVSDAGIFWLQTDPVTGSSGLWHLSADGPAPFGPPGQRVRSRVNGYGGGAIAASKTGVFVVGEDQQVRFIAAQTGECSCLTRETSAAFGGLVADPVRHRVLAVRECHGQQQLVAVYVCGTLRVLHTGEDFYSAAALSTDGNQVAWVSWRLPDMPWQRTRLFTATIDNQGDIRDERTFEPPSEGSLQQPHYRGGDLWVLSDHEGWWQPWCVVNASKEVVWAPARSLTLDHANAPWQLGESHYCDMGGAGWARVCYHNGVGELHLFSSPTCGGTRIAATFSDFRCLQFHAGCLYCIARSPSALDALLRIQPHDGTVEVIAGNEHPMPNMPIAQPRTFEVSTGQAGQAPIQGFLYLPPASTVPPPLILTVHGGPTSAAYPVYDPHIQYWCQRGFAVAEVNYRGSSGYGRAFRMALEGCWGEVDVEDMERAVDHLAVSALIDRRRCFIQGRSSGGLTTLMALIRSQRFAAGASHFGVTDPLRLRANTHRFESGYLDWLIGSPDRHPGRWHSRTPLNHAGRIRTPVIFFQGGLDNVVVPQQTRVMVNAMRAAGSEPELHWFETEGHGFRNPAHQAAMLEWTLNFYRRHIHSI